MTCATLSFLVTTAADLDQALDVSAYASVRSVSIVCVTSAGAPEAVGMEVAFVENTDPAKAAIGTTPYKRKLYCDRVTPQTDSIYLLGAAGMGYQIPKTAGSDRNALLYLFVDGSAMASGTQAWVVVELDL